MSALYHAITNFATAKILLKVRACDIIVSMKDGLRFYKLNKRKRYGAEGTRYGVGKTILLATVFTIMFALGIAYVAVNYKTMFGDAGGIVFILVYFIFLSFMCGVVIWAHMPLIKRINRARKIFKNCTLTDGVVLKVDKEKRQHNGTRTYTYYKVNIRYKFYGTDGQPHYGEFSDSYGEAPFYEGQNLLIAFNGSDSVIMYKWSLSDGAEQFAEAEREREQPDFDGLTGKLIKIDRSKPIDIAEYPWSLFLKIAKHRSRLDKILNGTPHFTVGRYFLKKNAYRYKTPNDKFYCYIDDRGERHVEECEGIENLKDGQEVVIAYGGGLSEIITGYTLIKLPKPRKKKSQ